MSARFKKIHLPVSKMPHFKWRGAEKAELQLQETTVDMRTLPSVQVTKHSPAP